MFYSFAWLLFFCRWLSQVAVTNVLQIAGTFGSGCQLGTDVSLMLAELHLDRAALAYQSQPQGKDAKETKRQACHLHQDIVLAESGSPTNKMQQWHDFQQIGHGTCLP
jgi:hypothetical protein